MIRAPYITPPHLVDGREEAQAERFQSYMRARRASGRKLWTQLTEREQIARISAGRRHKAKTYEAYQF